jgi:hypothetical protein
MSAAILGAMKRQGPHLSKLRKKKRNVSKDVVIVVVVVKYHINTGFHSCGMTGRTSLESVDGRDYLPACCKVDNSSLGPGGLHELIPLGHVFNVSNLNQAYRILLKSPKLIAIHRANYMRDVDDELSLGPGGFVTALESAANCTACVMGKPSNEFFQSAMWPDIAVEETCMIGDDIVGDIQGAKDAGIGTTILVRTGKYRTGDEQKSAPTAICDSIVQAVDYILAMDNNNY